MHLLPSFYIIGERKCGTSSLYRYLIKHPNVLPCELKEPNFFGKGHQFVNQNIQDYWKLFPTKKYQGNLEFVWPELNKEGILFHENVNIERKEDQKYITGEASANTFYQVDPNLVFQHLPKVKLILLLRNPVDRAFSHHRMYKRFQDEGRKLGFKVQDFEADVRAEMKGIKEGFDGEYLSPGLYLKQLKKWSAVYPEHQLKIFTAEELKEHPTKVLQQLLQYLELPDYNYGDFILQQFNKAPQAQISTALYEELATFFRPYNEALESYLNRKFYW